MTFTLGKKSAIAAAILLILGIGFAVWSVRKAEQQAVLDAEREALILEIQSELDGSMDEAKDATDQAAEYKQLANEERDKRLAIEAELSGAPQRPLEPSQGLEPPEDGCEPLRRKVGLYKAGYEHAVAETKALRSGLALTEEALALTNASLSLSEDKYDLMNKRYTALKRNKKKAKRRSIWAGVGTAVGMFAIGYGVGAVSK